MEIKLEQCLLRPWRAGDEESLVLNANDRDVSRNLRDLFPFPYTMNDAQEWIDRAGRRVPQTDFAIEVDGAAVGGIGIIPGSDVYRRTAEIGYWLGKSYWGRGLMTEAAKAVTDYAFQNFDYCRLQARVFEWNLGSQRVLAKAGYEMEGRRRMAVTKEGKTADEIIFALVRST